MNNPSFVIMSQQTNAALLQSTQSSGGSSGGKALLDGHPILQGIVVSLALALVVLILFGPAINGLYELIKNRSKK